MQKNIRERLPPGVIRERIAAALFGFARDGRLIFFNFHRVAAGLLSAGGVSRATIRNRPERGPFDKSSASVVPPTNVFCLGLINYV